MKDIYLDHAASTPLDPQVLETMLPYMTTFYGNPSSVHGFGRKMHRALEESRRSLGRHFNVRPEELYFLSGGTEANNWALEGIMSTYGQVGDHLIVSACEHPSVINTAKALESKGYEVTYIKPDGQGRIALDALEDAIQENTRLLSVMMVNNETGVYQDIRAMARLAKDKGLLCHTDGVQALSHMAMDLRDLGVDLMSFSGHKVNGPVGIGCLYIRAGIKMKSLIHGGAQERSRRAGTSLTALAVGLAKAVELRSEIIEDYRAMLAQKKTYFYEALRGRIQDIHVNGAFDHSHPGIINIRFSGVSAENLLMNLDLAGIYVSSGSACASGALSASHVLLSMGLTSDQAKSSLRFSFGETTSQEALDSVVDKLDEVVSRLRGI